ncbi:MAG: nuclear transport factor 2 family protein [Niabella sp.]
MDNKELIAHFFNAFARLDHEEMNNCLSSEVMFSEPLFGILQGDDVSNLNRMKCARLKDFKLKVQQVEELDDEYLTCSWVVDYCHADTGSRVVMPIKSFLRVIDGKITEYSDAYRLSTWLAKVHGVTGVLFGWTGTMKKRAMKKYAVRLANFGSGDNALPKP